MRFPFRHLILWAALFIAVLALCDVSRAQAQPAPINNFYAAGLSWNSAGTPQIGGDAMYAHRIDDAGDYAFTHVDALPASKKPFTVTTNVGTGIARKVFTVGKYDVYAASAIGIRFGGASTNWQYNAGAIVPIRLKGNFGLAPTARFIQAPGDGSGIQPIIGLNVWWGN